MSRSRTVTTPVKRSNSVNLPELTMEEDIISSGLIRFHDYGIKATDSPFICLKAEADVEMAWKQMTGSRRTGGSVGWKLPRPKLIISITGGARCHTMVPQVMPVLKQGLVKTALTADAWIVTGGSATGVMKLVGEAVQEHALAYGSLQDNTVVALGITSLDYITNSESFSAAKKNPAHPVHYYWTKPGSRAPLDHNHSHFLLVKNSETMGEIEFRSRFEEYISKQMVSSGVHIPVVLVVVEGGVNTLKSVAESVKRGTPVVVIANSGRAADLITEAFNLTTQGEEGSVFTADFDQVMAARGKELFDVTEEKAQEAVVMLRDCLIKRSLVKIFNLEGAESLKDIERVILDAALEANRSDLSSQLGLVLALNCLDIARHKIFTYNYLKNRQDKDSSVLNDAMFTALIQDQADFVQLFLHYGLDLERFLTTSVLHDLYSHSMTSEITAELLKYAFSGAPQKKFVWRREMPDFKNDPYLLCYISKVVVHLLKDNGTFYPDHYKVVQEFKDEKKAGGAEEHVIRGALYACALLKVLSVRAEKKELVEQAENMAQEAEVWEGRAVGVLNECYSSDPAMTFSLLVRELLSTERHPWTVRPTLLSMAQLYKMMDFVGHTACQTKLNDVWKGSLALYTSHFKIMLCVFLPVLLFTMNFRSPDHEKRGVGRQTGLISVSLTGSQKSSISLLQAVYYFYSAPVTKFLMNMVSYLVFLALFSYFLVVELDEGPTTVVEGLTWLWLLSMIMEEVRQMVFSSQLSLKYRLQDWFSSAWNRVDLAMYLLFLVSICLRFSLTGAQFRWARALYSVTLIIFYLRSLHFFFAVKSIGPKVLMIHKMLSDLFLFLAILLVFVVGFGVAYHANMFPKAPADWTVLGNILYFPYFQIYGELFLENMQGDDVDGCTRNESVWRQAGGREGRRCPERNDVLTLFLSVYMILTHILLVNLLIAMFSYTFTLVQENSHKLWRYYRLSLVHEYFDRPTFVPPFMIFNHLYRVVRYWCPCWDDKYNDFKLKVDIEEHRHLSAFERKCLERYVLLQDQPEESAYNPQLVLNINKRTETMQEDLEKVKETLQQLTSALTLQMMPKRPATSPDEACL